MKGILIFILVAFALAFAQQNTKIDSIVAKYQVGYKIFSNKLYKLLSTSIHGNLIVCPLSAQYALAMTLAGAKGSTEREVRVAMNYNLNSSESKKLWVYMSKRFNDDGENYKILSANGIFVDNDFEMRESYKGIIENHYRSKCESVEFEDVEQTVQRINQWVKERTRKIDRFLEITQLSEATSLLVANAVYLSAKWLTPFKVAETRPGDFRVTLTKNKTVNYMHCSRKALYGYDEILGAKFLEFPFAGVNKSLVVVLPVEKDGLKSMEAKLEQVLAFNEIEEEYVDITLPKFNFHTLAPIKPVLQNLGVGRIFNKNLADLSGISAKKGLFVNTIVQKAFISVNEVGIEAGASTAAMVSTKQLPRPGDVTFNADHPFLFYVKVDPGHALFIGRVVSPDEAAVETPRNIEEDTDEKDYDEK